MTRNASSSFSMGQGFGADLIENDDGALQMRVSGFDGPPVRIEVMNLMGHRPVQSRGGGGRSHQGSSDDRAEIRSFLSDMMPGSLVSSHLQSIRAATPHYVYPRGARPGGSIGTAAVGIGESSPYPVTHPLLKVSDPGQARLLQNAAAGRTGSSGSSSGIFGAISSAIRERGLQGHDDVRQSRLSVSTRRRALGPIVSDRRWGTDIGEVEIVGSRMPTLLVTVENSLYDEIEAPKEREKDKVRKERPGHRSKAPGSRIHYLHDDMTGDDSGSDDEFSGDDGLTRSAFDEEFPNIDPPEDEGGDEDDEDDDDDDDDEEMDAELYDEDNAPDHDISARDAEECKEEGELEETKEGDNDEEVEEEEKEDNKEEENVPESNEIVLMSDDKIVEEICTSLSLPAFPSSVQIALSFPVSLSVPAATDSPTEIQGKDGMVVEDSGPSDSQMHTGESPISDACNNSSRTTILDVVATLSTENRLVFSATTSAPSTSSTSSSSSSTIRSAIIEPYVGVSVSSVSLPTPVPIPVPVPVPVPIKSGTFPGVSDEVWAALPFEMQTELLVSVGMQAEADALLDAEITATGMSQSCILSCLIMSYFYHIISYGIISYHVVLKTSHLEF